MDIGELVAIEVVEIDKKISVLTTELNVLKEKRDAVKKSLIDEKVKGGWQKFSFESSYYGSHPEYDGDKQSEYLFHPEIDISYWEGVSFSHGSHGQREENDEWDKWFESLAEDQYIEL